MPSGTYAALAVAIHTDPNATADVRALAPPDARDANAASRANDDATEEDSDTGPHCHPETHASRAARSGLVARALSKVGDYATSIVSHACPSALLIRWRTHSASQEPLSPRLDSNPTPPAETAAPPRPVRPQLGSATPASTRPQSATTSDADARSLGNGLLHSGHPIPPRPEVNRAK